MNAQTKELKKLGLCSIKSRAKTKSAKERLPTIRAVEHGKNAFLAPDQAKKRKSER